jgi:hypothetical protein
MNNINKKLTVFLTALMLSFSTVAFSFEGFSIGATYSSLDFDTTGTESAEGDIGTGLTKNTTSKTGSGELGSVFAEYTFAQGTTMGISMIQGTAELGNAQRVEATSTTSGTVKVKAEISDPTTFYVEPTWMASDVFGVYVKGAATKVSVEPKEVSDTGGVVTSTYKSEDVWGFGTGVGAKYYMGNFFAKLEYLKTDFQAYNHASTTGDKNKITADIETEETNLSIGYNF